MQNVPNVFGRINEKQTKSIFSSSFLLISELSFCLFSSNSFHFFFLLLFKLSFVFCSNVYVTKKNKIKQFEWIGSASIIRSKTYVSNSSRTIDKLCRKHFPEHPFWTNDLKKRQKNNTSNPINTSCMISLEHLTRLICYV